MYKYVENKSFINYNIKILFYIYLQNLIRHLFKHNFNIIKQETIFIFHKKLTLKLLKNIVQIKSSPHFVLAVTCYDRNSFS